MKALFINCSVAPFIDDIIALRKPYETRSRNTLRALIDQHVMLTETGRPEKLCRAAARIGTPLIVRSAEEWNRLRPLHRVPEGSKYDWQPWTKVKYMYPVTDVHAVAPFTPPEGVRHGRVWMEC